MAESREQDVADILVVGGGPVGLHAALKAAVLNHRVLLVDKGRRFSRVSQAGAIANLPGHSSHVSGAHLIEEGWRKLAEFEEEAGKDLVRTLPDAEAIAARRDADGVFHVTVRDADGDEREVAGHVLVLATGLVDRKPGIEKFHQRGHETLAPYVHRGEIGYCVLCEGWAVEGKRVGVIGSAVTSAQIAAELTRHFHGHVTLLTDGTPLPGEADPGRLEKAGVAVDERVIDHVEDADGRLGVVFADGARSTFDKAFFSLGWYKVNNEVAVQLGAATTDEGFVVTDENGEAVDADGETIRGLFAVGDLRAGRWKQIVVGWGDAETAIITAFAQRLQG